MHDYASLLYLFGYVTIPIILGFILLPILMFVPNYLLCTIRSKPRPTFLYYKWGMIKKGPQGIASKVLLAVAIALLCSGMVLFDMALAQGDGSDLTSIAGTILGLSHPAVIVGLVLGYLPQFAWQKEETQS